MSKIKIFPVLIAGGRGMRFWPLSRKGKPKPLLCLCSKKPMICEVCSLVKPMTGCDNIFIATSRSLAQEIKKVLPEVPEENYILEPEPRDTAPALGLSLAFISRKVSLKGQEPVLAFIPSDQFVQKPEQFRRTLKTAVELAFEKNLIITVGVKPDFPSTSYGYIQPGERIKGFKNSFRVKSFKEKPVFAKARQYMKKGFFWNAGIFIMKPSVLWSAFREHQPRFYKHLQKIFKAKPSKFNSVLENEFPKLKKISFDYAILEKAQNVAVVRGDYGFKDIGSYSALDQILGEESIKNLGKGMVIQKKSENITVFSEKLILALGAKNLVIVETGDAILIMDKGCEEELKNMVREMERKGLKKYL